MEQSYLFEMIEKADVSLRARNMIHHPAGYAQEKHISDFDVLYTLSGKHFFRVNGKEYVCYPGDVLLLAPNTMLSVRCEEPSDQYYCHFTIGMGEEYEVVGDFCEHRLPESCRGLAQLYREHFELSNKEESPLISSVSMIFKLFIIELLRADPRSHISFESLTAPEKPKALFEILHEIHEHLTENITVESLAEIAGFHPSYFSRYFKRYMGMSPVRYISEQKMNLAKHMVSTTEKPLGEIAETLGFPDQFSFSKKFKDRFGVSPSEFRKIRI
ncbi:MAG: AraC family transcriptional regulator [Oscillospiraceae bacterium]|nr:AraC family transcriptional regulator [Oscillospiraceae bacterium]